MQGLILLNKPQNITSFGAVAKIKYLASEKRVGHTGTLDPMATGVLPIFLGPATALSSYLLDGDKSYTATIKLGIKTDTLDITGKILEENDVRVNNEEILNVLSGFVGRIEQTPPMYSAIKKDGVRLYDLARKGIEIEIPKRQVEIYSLLQTAELNRDNEFPIDVTVSKGTYIRSLCRDIGEKLGCGATLTSLCRTKAAGFDIKDCVSLDNLTKENITDYLKSEEVAVSYLPELIVTEKQGERFCNGGQLSFDRLQTNNFKNGELFRIKSGGRFLGIGFADCEREQIGIKCVIRR